MTRANSPQLERLQTPAGHAISARLFRTDSDAPKGVCILAPATGVAQYLYDDLAHWLSGHGFHVVTFDYQGIGLSLEGNIRDCRADVLSWANQDCPTLLRWVATQFPSLERTWIGHSVGGHLLGMMPATHLIDRAITVAAGTGTWWLNAWPTKRIVWFLWFVLVPLLVPLYGYFPGKRIGIMCDLPKGVIQQWRRWCLCRDYAPQAEGDWLWQRFAQVKQPITALAFSDDEMMSKASIDALHGFFSGSEVTRIEISPAQIGKKRIGHIGWHRRGYEALWQHYLLPLLPAAGDLPVTPAAQA